MILGILENEHVWKTNVYTKNANEKDSCIWNQRKTVGVSWKRKEEIVLGDFVTHRTYRWEDIHGEIGNRNNLLTKFM